MKYIQKLKRNIKILFFILVVTNFGIAQNLVTNAGMDAKCIPSGYGEIIATETWHNANGGSVDLFDKKKQMQMHCNRTNGIPVNYMGYQPLTISGQNYAGIIAYYDDGSNYHRDNDTLKLKDGYKKYSEYLEGELAEPLVAGKVYQISFKVSLADKSGRAVSCLGALFTPEKMDQKSNAFITQKPQFISHRVISDSINWVTIYGAYIAAGGEKFITIGCFKDENFQVQNVVGKLQNDSRKAYYYIADAYVGPYIAKPDLDAVVYGVDYVELMNLQFASASSDISPQFYNELDEVATWMTKHPEMSFYIAGYTDLTGTNSINDPLSIRRANEVKKYLVQKGIKESNIVTDGFGSSNPIEYKTKSRQNRRVEIYLLSMTNVSKL